MNEEIEMIKMLIVVSGLMNMFLLFVMFDILKKKADNTREMIKGSYNSIHSNTRILNEGLQTILDEVNKK